MIDSKSYRNSVIDQVISEVRSNIDEIQLDMVPIGVVYDLLNIIHLMKFRERDPGDTEMLDWMERHRAEIEEIREGWKVMWLDENGDVLSTDGEYCHQRDAIKAAMQSRGEYP